MFKKKPKPKQQLICLSLGDNRTEEKMYLFPH